MSSKIYRKKDQSDIAFTPLALEDAGALVDESQGFKPLVLPDISGLGVVPSQSAVTGGASTGDSLSDVRRQATDILTNAELRAKEMEEAALREAMDGFDEKLAAAVAEATAELRDQFTASLERIADLGNNLSERIERDLVGLALAVAKKVIGREIQTDQKIVIDLLNSALAKLQERSLAEVHLNPADLEYIEAHRSDVTFRGTLDLVGDPSISVGGCLIHTANGDIDARINSQFDELSHGLLDA